MFNQSGHAHVPNGDHVELPNEATASNSQLMEHMPYWVDQSRSYAAYTPLGASIRFQCVCDFTKASYVTICHPSGTIDQSDAAKSLARMVTDLHQSCHDFHRCDACKKNLVPGAPAESMHIDDDWTISTKCATLNCNMCSIFLDAEGKVDPQKKKKIYTTLYPNMPPPKRGKRKKDAKKDTTRLRTSWFVTHYYEASQHVGNRIHAEAVAFTLATTNPKFITNVTSNGWLLMTPGKFSNTVNPGNKSKATRCFGIVDPTFTSFRLLTEHKSILPTADAKLYFFRKSWKDQPTWWCTCCFVRCDGSHQIRHDLAIGTWTMQHPNLSLDLSNYAANHHAYRFEEACKDSDGPPSCFRSTTCTTTAAHGSAKQRAPGVCNECSALVSATSQTGQLLPGLLASNFYILDSIAASSASQHRHTNNATDHETNLTAILQNQQAILQNQQASNGEQQQVNKDVNKQQHAILLQMSSQRKFIESNHESNQQSLREANTTSQRVCQAMRNATADVLKLKQQLETAMKKLSAVDVWDNLEQLIRHGEGDLSTPQANFLQVWAKKSRHPKCHIPQLLQDLSILAILELTKQTYNTLRPFLSLPSYDHVLKLKAKHELNIKYQPGNNDKAWTIASNMFKSKWVMITSDGTRVRRTIALLWDVGLAGVCFPPDFTQWPHEEPIDPAPAVYDSLLKYVDIARRKVTLLAHEVLTVAVHSLHGCPTFVPVMLIPEAPLGFDAHDNILLQFQSAKLAWDNGMHAAGWCEDSCQTNHAAGLEVMTPRADKMDLDKRTFVYWIGLDIPGWRYFRPLMAVGIPGQTAAVTDASVDPDVVQRRKSKRLHEFFAGWYGEHLHTQRNLRKNTQSAKKLLFRVNEDLTQVIARLTELKQVEKALKLSGVDPTKLKASFAEMYTMNSMMDQNTKAAKSFNCLQTISLVIQARAEAAYPLAYYMLMGFYLFEPYTNPKFTRPKMVACFLWTAKLMLEKLEAYVQHHMPGKKDLFLLSGTTRRTMEAMAASGITHILAGWRKQHLHRAFGEDLDPHLLNLSLVQINTKTLEGYHGILRTQGNDTSMNFAEWLHAANKMILTLNLRLSLAINNGFDPTSARYKKHDSDSLYGGVVPENLVPLIGVAGVLTANDLLHGIKPDSEHITHPQDYTSYKDLHDDMVSGCELASQNSVDVYRAFNVGAAKELEEAGLLLKEQSWIDRRPPAMVLVMEDDNPTHSMDPMGAAEIKPFQLKRAQRPVPEEQPAGDASNQWTFEASTRGKKDAADLTASAQELRALVLNIKTEGTACKGNSGLQMTCPRNKDLVSYRSVLSFMQQNEVVPRERWKRFMVTTMPEHRQLLNGHNCTAGTLLFMVLFDETCALGRVVSINECDQEPNPRSCNLKPKKNNAVLTCEICYMVKSNSSNIEFLPSGACLPTLLAKNVLQIGVKVDAWTSTTIYLGLASCQQVLRTYSLAEDGCLANVLGSVGSIDSEQGIHDEPCARCTRGMWWDATGPMAQCLDCQRCFHPSCIEGIEFKDGICARCADPLQHPPCVVCDKEWEALDKCCDSTGRPDPSHTGELIECSQCKHKYHTGCIGTEITISFARWQCIVCKPDHGAAALVSPLEQEILAIAKLKVGPLRQRLSAVHLSPKGTKPIIVKRLQDHVRASAHHEPPSGNEEQPPDEPPTGNEEPVHGDEEPVHGSPPEPTRGRTGRARSNDTQCAFPGCLVKGNTHEARLSLRQCRTEGCSAHFHHMCVAKFVHTKGERHPDSSKEVCPQCALDAMKSANGNSSAPKVARLKATPTRRTSAKRPASTDVPSEQPKAARTRVSSRATVQSVHPSKVAWHGTRIREPGSQTNAQRQQACLSGVQPAVKKPSNAHSQRGRAQQGHKGLPSAGNDLEIYWLKEKKWYQGKVMAIDRQGKFEVLYTDRDRMVYCATDGNMAYPNGEMVTWRPLSNGSLTFSALNDAVTWAPNKPAKVTNPKASKPPKAPVANKKHFEWVRVVGIDEDKTFHILWAPCAENDFSSVEVTQEHWCPQSPEYVEEHVPDDVICTAVGLRMAGQLKGSTLYVFTKDHHTTGDHYEVVVLSIEPNGNHKVLHVADKRVETLNLLHEWAWICKEHHCESAAKPRSLTSLERHTDNTQRSFAPIENVSTRSANPEMDLQRWTCSLKIRRWKSKYDEAPATQAKVVSSLELTTMVADDWMPPFVSVTTTSMYSGGYHRGIDLKTKCGRRIGRHKAQEHRLLRSPTGILYVASRSPQNSWCCGHASSTPSCSSCGAQGIVEPLSNILGTLGREQLTARWRVVLFLKIMEAKNLAPDIAESIFRFIPRPGTVASMMMHPVCKCNDCTKDRPLTPLEMATDNTQQSYTPITHVSTRSANTIAQRPKRTRKPTAHFLPADHGAPDTSFRARAKLCLSRATKVTTPNVIAVARCSASAPVSKHTWLRVVGIDPDHSLHILWAPCKDNSFATNEVTIEPWVALKGIHLTAVGLQMASQSWRLGHRLNMVCATRSLLNTVADAPPLQQRLHHL